MYKSNSRVGIVGLGGVGQAISHKLLSTQTYTIIGYDTDVRSQESFAARGGQRGRSPQDVAKESDFLICSATTSEKIDEILLDGQTGAAKGEFTQWGNHRISDWPLTARTELPTGAVVLICSSVSLDYHRVLRKRINVAGRSDVFILDCPVSLGTKLPGGSLTMFASGPTEALERSDALIRDISEQIYHIHGGAGSANKISLVILLLTGIHSATAAEAIALAEKAGLNIQEVYDIIVGPAAGNSWAFESRVPRMIEGDWTPQSTVDDFVNDMVCSKDP